MFLLGAKIMRKTYSSDLTDEQFNFICPFLVDFNDLRGRQFIYPLKDTIDAILFRMEQMEMSKQIGMYEA